MAEVYAALGDNDRAFAWLERGYLARNGLLVWIAFNPRIDPLHGDPRFVAFLRRMASSAVATQ